jgi:NAD(P)-dependent dehydrogenase (short-subunit alcohol dehydrogenase family)
MHLVKDFTNRVAIDGDANMAAGKTRVAKKDVPLTTLLSLEGKRAMITGAAAGIGRAIARRFAEAGAALELADISEAALGRVGDELQAVAPSVHLHPADIATDVGRKMLWEAVADHPPDILVNNAGIYPFKGFLQVDAAFYDRVLDLNLGAVYWMCQEMISRRLKLGGVIINLASIEAMVAFKADLAHYSVSKAGVMALTRSLAREHGKDGFRINALLPGGIVTQGTKSAALGVLKFELGLVRTGLRFRERIPMGRLGDPDEVARMALVLASDLASYVQGTAVPVDGGFLSA